MRRYSTADEERIRTSAHVREWQRSGLLEKDQAAAIDADLRTDLRRTNRSLRVVLFIFASIVVLAAFGFALVVADLSNERSAAATAVAAGAIWFLVAEYLIAQYRLYRFGVEEAFAVWAIVFFAGGVGLFLEGTGELPIRVALLTAALASLAVYLRFGYLYAAIGAVGCAAAVPFFLEQSEAMARLLCASILFAVFLAARFLRRPYQDDFPGDDYGTIEAAAWLGLYAVLNLRLSFQTGPSGYIDAYYWGTYLLTWLLPAAGLYLGLRDKHRGMIWVNLLMALATLATNKAYLGMERHTWDPILLGVLLIAAVIALRRWLALGPDGQRHGFTATRLLASDRETLASLAMAAGAVQPLAVHHPAVGTPPPFEPGGGRSGGGGASGTF